MKMMKTVTALVLTLVLLVSALPMAVSADGKGDFDKNDRIDTNDVRLLMNCLAKGKDVTLTQRLWADMDMDSKLSTTDARKLLSAVMMDSLSPVTNYAKPTGADWWGENSVALLGDSISWGAGTSGGISEYSYVSYVKKAIQNYNSGKMNYGFVQAYTKQWAQGTNYTDSEEIFSWPSHTGWDETKDGNRLMKFGFQSVTPWSLLTFKLRSAYVNEYKYFTVYYHTEPGAGSFALANGSGGEVPYADGKATGYIPTNGNSAETMRTKFFKFSDCPKDSNGIPEIRICHGGTTEPVTITGIGCYKELPNTGGYVTFNSYSRGGAMLSELSYKVLEQAAKADTLIMSLGYNDMVWASNAGYSREDFINRIDYLIEKCNENGTQVVVNDFTWSNYNTISPYTGWNATMQAELDWRAENFSLHLRRMAEETGGVYVDHEAILGTDAIIPNLPDTVHPNNAGHKLIGQNVVAALGLTDYFTEEWK